MLSQVEATKLLSPLAEKEGRKRNIFKDSSCLTNLWNDIVRIKTLKYCLKTWKKGIQNTDKRN